LDRRRQTPQQRALGVSDKPVPAPVVTASEEKEFSRRLRDHLLAAPGVTGAAYSDSIPLGFGLGKWNSIVVEGYASRPGENSRM